MPAFEHDRPDLVPLFRSRVDARGVVCTGVHEEDGARGGAAKSGQEAGTVESDRAWVIVRIRDRLDGDIFENGVMVY